MGNSPPELPKAGFMSGIRNACGFLVDITVGDSKIPPSRKTTVAAGGSGPVRSPSLSQALEN
jgi:hypothetical protein